METRKPTICFATMCKNEEHCIRETLESVYKYIDYWIVCDTGSTDRTCEIVSQFFQEKNIPGELFVDEWIGFDKNKTKMFDRCYNKTDYILHLDADDLLEGDFTFTKEDAGKINYYCLCKRGASSAFTYKVQFMYNNRYHWKFCGVAHTIIRCMDPHGLTEGDLSDRPFFLNSRDTGNRSTDPEKYYKDALKLQAQFFETLLDDPDGLNARSIFYTARSYKDAGKPIEAAQWFSLYIKFSDSVNNKHKTWIEETYESYLSLGKLTSQLKYPVERVVSYYIRAMEIFADRAEAYLELGRYYNMQKKFQEAYVLLKRAKNIQYCVAKEKYRLFVCRNAYDKYLNDELSVACYWLGKYDEAREYIMEIIDDPDFAGQRERINMNLKYTCDKLGI